MLIHLENPDENRKGRERQCEVQTQKRKGDKEILTKGKEMVRVSSTRPSPAAVTHTRHTLVD